MCVSLPSWVMPEMTFGRSIRYRRTKLGLSQTRLGELVGRSGAAVRSWEKEASTPTDPSVLQALSAVLGIEEDVLFEKAGVTAPVVEDTATVEQVLGTLAPEESSEELDDQPEDSMRQPMPEPIAPLHEPKPVTVGVAATPLSPAPVATATATVAEPTSTGFVYTMPAPPVPEPSYMEDESQRQMYRVRHLGTLVLVVALIVLFVWALGNGWEAFTSWWDGLLNTLQI